MNSKLEEKRFLVAPDKFKGTLSASEAARCIEQAINSTLPRAIVRKLPMADGGDGSLELLLEGDFERVVVPSYNALLEPIDATYAVSYKAGKKIAFIEMAQICGISTLQGRKLQPQLASSFGLGDVASKALNDNVDEIIISVGGSASTDGGLGFLTGLGAVALNSKGVPVQPNLAGVKEVSSIDLSKIHPRIISVDSKVTWKFLVDVLNPLVGINGTAAIFGPQKGLTPEEIEEADSALRDWANLIYQLSHVDIATLPGSGAAGGAIAPALALFQYELQSGADWFASYFNLIDSIAASDIVITGEGCFDSQSMLGKGPGYVLASARTMQKEIVVLAGRIKTESEEFREITKLSLEEIAGSVVKASEEPLKWLTAATKKAIGLLEAKV